MTDRILIGKRPSDGQVGMWISKPGKDVSSSNSDDFLFDPTKYMARAYARVSPGRFTRGAFWGTQTYSDSSKADLYYWECFIPLPFGYVPLIIVQIGNDLNTNNVYDGLGYNGSGIYLNIGYAGVFRYLANDPNKTPIAGSMDPRYDPATQTLGLGTIPSTFIIYRNPLVGAV